nr:hypothetical protein BN993_05699 [Virgibacillus halodenitrificans]
MQQVALLRLSVEGPHLLGAGLLREERLSSPELQ